MTTAAQLRAARALLGWSQARAAEASGLSSMTIKRAEGSGKPTPSVDAVETIRKALEAAGVVFLSENGNGPGVALRKG
ncbi:MAG: helix-turn-helix transcriptional regulator [Paracoccaceae bacterium]|nr:helix-turn-helix transcriptional regulator [Paracoccaceae bacterium]